MEDIPTLVGSIIVVGELTGCALFHSECDLKAAQMNVQHSLIQELMLYLAVTLWKQLQVFVVKKMKAQLITL